MHEKDRQLAKDSVLAIADGIVATLPPLALAWGLSKALYGAGLKLRQDRALEWVEMIRDDPSIFTEKLLHSEEFQDGFVYALEKYIQERNKKKRKIAQNIFKGFTKSDNFDEFELEKFLSILSSISICELKELGRLAHENNIEEKFKVSFFHEAPPEAVYQLIQEGLLISHIYNARLAPVTSITVQFTGLGHRFIRFLEIYEN